jgi:hypothetical protein
VTNGTKSPEVIPDLGKYGNSDILLSAIKHFFNKY